MVNQHQHGRGRRVDPTTGEGKGRNESGAENQRGGCPPEFPEKVGSTRKKKKVGASGHADHVVHVATEQ